MKVFSFRNIRVVFLLSILAMAAIYTKEQHTNTTSWYKPIEVTIFPINGDGKLETDQYIEQLTVENFQGIDDFFIRGSKTYRLIVEQPIITTIGSPIHYHPPSPPADRSAIFQAILWSMKLRYWAYKNTPDDKSNKNRIRLYVLYHQGLDNQKLKHSLGVQKGLIGVIHAFADPQQNEQNALVMAHEILHTVGASDKYDRSNQPAYPEGYAEPDQIPLYPQRYAEIMAGRIPISDIQAKMPANLNKVIIGEATAKEINWIPVP